MKISKSLLQAIAAAVVISTASSCVKDEITTTDENGVKQKTKIENHDNCPACGMG